MKEIKNDEELLEFLKDKKLIKWKSTHLHPVRQYLDNRFNDYYTNTRYNSPYIV